MLPEAICARRVLGSAAAALLLGIMPLAAAAQVHEDLGTAPAGRLDSALVAVWEAQDAAAVQAALGMNGRVVWTGAVGMADLEHRVPVSDSTRFRTASVSKWMTATAAMRLSEEGRLDLDAPVQEYCPAYPEKRWTLTTRHLLAHRGGVRHYWGHNGEPEETPEHRAEIQRRSDQERLWQIVHYDDVVRPVARFAEDSLLFEPGTAYHYSSPGYRLVGCVLRGAAGEPYDTLMRERVFEPAGMRHTRDDDAYAVVRHRARGYVRVDGELRRSRFRDVSENLAAGGHLSTAADLVRFALAWNRGVLVDEASRRAMTAAPPDRAEEDTWYGYGVNVREVDGRTILFHTGGLEGARTLLVLLPAEDVAVAVLTNYESIRDGLYAFTNRALELVVEGRD